MLFDKTFTWLLEDLEFVEVEGAETELLKIKLSVQKNHPLDQ